MSFRHVRIDPNIKLTIRKAELLDSRNRYIPGIKLLLSVQPRRVLSGLCRNWDETWRGEKDSPVIHPRCLSVSVVPSQMVSRQECPSRRETR